MQVIERVQQKLTGRDFKPTQSLAVDAQVDRLIEQATSLSNLSQMFIGWCVTPASFSSSAEPPLTLSTPWCLHFFLHSLPPMQVPVL